MEVASKELSKPIEYHVNLIDALKALKACGIDGGSSWVERIDGKLVVEARDKRCIEDTPTGPVLTKRGEVVSRMKIRYERGQSADGILEIVGAIYCISAIVALLLIVGEAPFGWFGMPLSCVVGANLWAYLKVTGDDQVRRIVDIEVK